MKISQTPYYYDCIEFFRREPESSYATFSEEGSFSYINDELNIAVAVFRTSKSNYDVTTIVDGDIYTVTEHSFATACKSAQTAIQNARKGA